ncbi:MAG: exodeoxyribonuclease Xth [Betaproteobacteria bacterium]|nr:exodeoxyribonuclease Xth [Betaproteobacteria bacterium]
MRVATWNVNSLKVRLPQVLEWVKAQQPDVLCLQETKLEDAKFPVDDIQAAGYQVQFSGQKTYNGVAILSKSAAAATQASIPGFDDPQKRVLAATVDGIRVVCLYVPNGQSVESEKYRYKLDWFGRVTQWLAEELAANERLVVVGDFNVAPEECDVHDPKAWEGQVLVSEPERQALRGLVALGLKDSFRLFEQPPQSFTWWDYRMNAFRRKMGLRIDHILLSHPLAQTCKSCTIDVEPRRNERPSDHAPVIVEFAAE